MSAKKPSWHLSRAYKAAARPQKEIVVALMRKTIAIAQAVLKSQTTFNPELHTN